MYTEQDLISFGNYMLNGMFEIRDGQLTQCVVSDEDFNKWKNTTRLYVKRPLQVEAIQYTGLNGDEVIAFGEGDIREGETLLPTEENPMGCFCYVATREGISIGIVGDYFIKGIKGEFYPCGEEIFNETYEQV